MKNSNKKPLCGTEVVLWNRNISAWKQKNFHFQFRLQVSFLQRKKAHIPASSYKKPKDFLPTMKKVTF